MEKQMVVIKFGDVVLGPVNLSQEIAQAFQSGGPLNPKQQTILCNIVEHQALAAGLPSHVIDLILAGARNDLLELSYTSTNLGIWSCPKCKAVGTAPKELWNLREAHKRGVRGAARPGKISCDFCAAKFDMNDLIGA